MGTIVCPYCDVHSSTSTRTGTTQEGTAFEIVQCDTCKKLILFIQTWNGTKFVTTDQYPKRTPKLHQSIPKEVGDDYVEAATCFDAKANKASAAMCRRALQTSVLEKGVTKGRLVDQIDELYKSQIITKDIKEWAHEIRLTGNLGAHPDEDGLADITQKDAEELLKFIEEYLNYVYIMPFKVAEKRARKNLQKTAQ